MKFNITFEVEFETSSLPLHEIQKAVEESINGSLIVRLTPGQWFSPCADCTVTSVEVMK